MKNDNVEFLPQIDFMELTPKVLTERKKPDPLYEKAFLSREENSESEFCQNTTTWD